MSKTDPKLDRADTELGKTETALRKACTALNSHGDRENMLAQLRAIRDQIRAMDPIGGDIET